MLEMTLTKFVDISILCNGIYKLAFGVFKIIPIPVNDELNWVFFTNNIFNQIYLLKPLSFLSITN